MWATCFEIEGWEIEWFNSLRTVISLRDQGWRHGILTAPRKINGFHIIWIHHNMLPMRNLQVNAFSTLLYYYGAFHCQMDARFCTENSVPFCLKLLWTILSLHLGVVHLHLFHLWASRLDVGWWVRFCLGGRAGRVALGAGCRCLWIRPRFETNS